MAHCGNCDCSASISVVCSGADAVGRIFRVQAKATTLVTTGVYSRIRNPIYIFGAMFILGIIIWMGRPWLLLIFAVMIPLQVVRSRNEERVLTEKFGAAYLDYKQKTWF